MSDFRTIMRQATEQGWRVEYTKSNHLKWIAPDGKVVFSSSTPSDVRAVKNHVSMMKRNGFRP